MKRRLGVLFAVIVVNVLLALWNWPIYDRWLDRLVQPRVLPSNDPNVLIMYIP